MIGRKTELILNRAVEYALENDHEYFTVEHVLWSLLNDPEIQEIIAACGSSHLLLLEQIELYLKTEVPKATSLEDKEMDSLSESPEDDSLVEHPVATLGIQRLIQRALFHVQSAGKDEIQPRDLLVALFQSKDSKALFLLKNNGIERLDVLNFISHGIHKGGSPVLTDRKPEDEHLPQTKKEGGVPSQRNESIQQPSLFGFKEAHDRMKQGGDRVASSSPGGNASGGASTSHDPLQLFAFNLNERAKAGKIDPLIGRKLELERMIQTLCRRRKNNPLLVGEAGVGKTALAEGLALRIIEGEVPDLLKNAVIYALDMGALIAGAKYRGDFEQRFKRVLSALQSLKEKNQQPILHIDEIHTVIGAGAVSGGAMDAANLLKPVLSQGELRCIGSTTYQEFRNVFEKDHALARRFQKIDVTEPSQEEAIQILMGLKSRFEEHHQVTFTPEAIRAAVELSFKHLTDRFLPDKAIDVLDETGARARLKKTQEDKQNIKLDAPEVEEVIAQIARIPARSVSVSQKARLHNLERDLKFTIYGQDHAIDALVTSIRLARSGLRTGDRPVGCFLFCGPTGVGKTELSKQLAHCLGVPFLRYDMSEYSEKHTVSRLIGAPPGYVGFEQAGLLTDSVLKNPHAVVLLDEIEKAHSDIWNILLQVMDHGMLTDNNGRKADFRNTIIILTSNVGSREMERKPIGVAGVEISAKSFGEGAKKAVEQTFSPEFRNRLDSIVYFNALDPIAVAQVVGKQILELESQLLAKGVEIELTPEVREWLAQKGYDKLMGARPMARVIQDHLKRPLSEEILFGKLEKGGRVKVIFVEGKLQFEFSQKVEVSEPASVSNAPESSPG